jgi:hypothetical protein
VSAFLFFFHAVKGKNLPRYYLNDLRTLFATYVKYIICFHFCQNKNLLNLSNAKSKVANISFFFLDWSFIPNGKNKYLTTTSYWFVNYRRPWKDPNDSKRILNESKEFLSLQRLLEWRKMIAGF